MTRGRKPKPTAVLKLTGAYRRDRHGDRDKAPQPQPAAPKRPSWLKGEARRTWDRLAPELVKLGLLTEIDLIFATYCAEWSLYVNAMKQLKDAAGCVGTTSNGNEVQKVLRGVANTALGNCLKIAAEYGLSPSSRTRLRVHVADHEIDPLEELLQRQKKQFFR